MQIPKDQIISLIESRLGVTRPQQSSPRQITTSRKGAINEQHTL
jgi:hypothetical protein